MRHAVGFFLRAESHTALVGHSSHGVDVRQRLAGLGPDDGFAVAGDPDTVTERLGALLDAGADSLRLWIFPPAQLGRQLERLAADFLPAISG